MTTVTPPPPPDSGTQPAPHYCMSTSGPDGRLRGCADWPGCLFPLPPLPAGRVIVLTKPTPDIFDDEPEPDDEDEIPGIAQNLAVLLGGVVALMLLLVAVVVLVPFVV